MIHLLYKDDNTDQLLSVPKRTRLQEKRRSYILRTVHMSSYYATSQISSKILLGGGEEDEEEMEARAGRDPTEQDSTNTRY